MSVRYWYVTDMCVSSTCKTRGVPLLRLPILLGVTEVLERIQSIVNTVNFGRNITKF